MLNNRDAQGGKKMKPTRLIGTAVSGVGKTGFLGRVAQREGSSAHSETACARKGRKGDKNPGLTGVSRSGGRGAAGDARSLTSPEVGRGDHLGGRREAKIEQGPPRTNAT